MRFLVVGCGSIGRRHLKNLQTLGITDLTALDLLSERRNQIKTDFGIPVATSLTDALAERPDVVLVTTPTSLHIPLALEAAKQGCHLFVEKPLSNNLDGVDELAALVSTKKSIAMVGCNMRFHPGVSKVKQLLDEGQLGNLISARAQVGQWLPDWHPQEDYRDGYSSKSSLGGGIILDAVHEIDYIQWIVGKQVDKVACFAGHLSSLEISTEDNAGILLRFAGGSIGEIHMDYVDRSASRSCYLVGEQGSIRWDQSDHRVSRYTSASKRWEHFDYDIQWDPNQMYLDELSHYLDCIRLRKQPVHDLGGAKRVLEIALAAKLSSETGTSIELGV